MREAELTDRTKALFRYTRTFRKCQNEKTGIFSLCYAKSIFPTYKICRENNFCPLF